MTTDRAQEIRTLIAQITDLQNELERLRLTEASTELSMALDAIIALEHIQGTLGEATRSLTCACFDS